jgi:phage terminase small subunit
MAGKPGKSGGARVGCGRKKKEPVKIQNIKPDSELEQDDPKEFLLLAMNDSTLDARLRIDAAKSLMPFMYVKKGEGGKKDEKQEAAKKAGAGKFSPAAPPRLVVNNQ